MQQAEEQLYVFRTVEELDALIELVKDAEVMAIDTETTGLASDSKIIGFSVSTDVESGFYVITAYWDKDKQQLIELETNKHAHRFFEAVKGKMLVMHNALFDCRMINSNYGVQLIDSVHTDTMLQAHLLNENASIGLKELGAELFGESAKKEKEEMLASIEANGGSTTRTNYELYKADADLIGRYGAKDTLLTLKLFYVLTEQLFAEKLDGFFYDDETMPLLRGAGYDLNTVGLKVDIEKMKALKAELETQIFKEKSIINDSIKLLVKEKYPGTNKNNHFNINSNTQLAWLLFIVLNNHFVTLTKKGKEVARSLIGKVPYSVTDKKEFIRAVRDARQEAEAEVLELKNIEAAIEVKTAEDKLELESIRAQLKEAKSKVTYYVPEKYMKADKGVLNQFSNKYNWVKALLRLKQAEKLLGTYVEGIMSRMQYGIIYPEFKLAGTTSGRMSSKNPNFQNLPRDDKRVKSCIISRPGKSFVGADFSQLEPRVFTAISQDQRLIDCFRKKQDFYSVIGVDVFDKPDASVYKDDEDSFANKFNSLRNATKTFSLAATYGAKAFQLAQQIKKENGDPLTTDEAEEILNNYFNRFPDISKMVQDAHNEAKKYGVVYSLAGRPRRIPMANDINKRFPGCPINELPYEYRTLLNLAVNHKMQSTAATITNRACIKFKKKIKELNIPDTYVVMQVHDEVIVECPDEYAKQVAEILKESMETAFELKNVALVAKPVIAKNLADLK